MPLTDVPLSSQTLAETQPTIRSNFSTINTAFAIDHVPYVDSGQGKHKKVTFPDNSDVIHNIAGEITLFNKTTALTGIPDIWMQRGDVALSAKNPIPITGSLKATNGWTYLPSGILIKWGNITGAFPNGTWQNFFYPVAADIPVFTTVFNVTLQAVSTDVPPGAQTQTFNYLTVASNFSATDFWWIPRTNFGNVNQQSLFYYVIGN